MPALVKPIVLRFPVSMSTLVDNQISEEASHIRVSITKAIYMLTGETLFSCRNMMQEGMRSGSLKLTTAVRESTDGSVSAETRYEEAVTRLKNVGVIVEAHNPLLATLREFIGKVVVEHHYDLASDLIAVLKKHS